MAVLIERMARENLRWGYQGIQGVTQARPPGRGPRRSVASSRGHGYLQHRSGTTDTTWRQFLRTQASMMVACGYFFPVDCAVTLQQISVFVVLEIGTRSVHLLDVTTNPDGRWTTQHLRTLVRDLGERTTPFRFLTQDRTSQFTASSDAVLADVGIRVVRIPPRCPQANCSAGRLVRTLPQMR